MSEDSFVIDTTGKTPEQLDSLRQMTLIIYILYAASWLTGITAIIAIVLNYVKREDAAGTIYESHFTWQIRTFWWALAWSILGFITLIVIVGWGILLATGIWCIYRAVKGLVYWSERKPMPVQS